MQESSFLGHLRPPGVDLISIRVALTQGVMDNPFACSIFLPPLTNLISNYKQSTPSAQLSMSQLEFS